MWDRGADAVQEAFARAIRLRHGYRASGSLEGWIWRIVVKSARDQSVRPELRHATNTEAVPFETVAPDTVGVREALGARCQTAFANGDKSGFEKRGVVSPSAALRAVCPTDLMSENTYQIVSVQKTPAI